MPTGYSPKPIPTRSQAPSTSARRFLTRAEAVTLLGVILILFSIFLVWERIPVPQDAGGLRMEPISHQGRTVLQGAFWALIGGAVGCGAVLLWTPNRKNNKIQAAAQGACSLLCLVVVLSRCGRETAMQPGVLVALAGCAALVFGALDRFYDAAKPN